ncbi:toll/interleukin-1 receptor domain-containing protein [Alteromonas sp. BL110]|uniref:toll/interleukin-1 receptor domain-containing protein n=1 Tax=Alteromonas sp. BL110 TaxID=1714845 RepID=UPI00217D468A|nr:toll/interleukin-1 receptor domain-containing protein [Alteromonas sp. BL110]
MNQASLAKEVGVSQPVISLLERGSPIGINEDRIDLLKSTLGIVDAEIPTKEKVKTTSKRKQVFISYSHRDKTYFDRLSTHLKPLEKKGLIEPWSDTRISAGELWKKQIESALNKTQVAVLLVSADFLASDFIVDNELPPLLEKASSDGATIIPVILKPCRFIREETIAKFQAINTPEEPLIAASEHESELIYDAIAERIESLL